VSVEIIKECKFGAVDYFICLRIEKKVKKGPKKAPQKVGSGTAR